MRCEEEGVEVRRWENDSRGQAAREVVARSGGCLQGVREVRGMGSCCYLTVSGMEPVEGAGIQEGRDVPLGIPR